MITNNDILRRIRYAFDFRDKEMIEIFKAADFDATPEQVNGWLKKEQEVTYKECDDLTLAIFLNGLINHKRGKQDGPQRLPEAKLTNNIIFMKLRIALNLKSNEVLRILSLADQKISEHELSALFRKPDHKHYRECKAQLLRKFLNGMQIMYRETPKNKVIEKTQHYSGRKKKS